jgi:hypothetical protein
MYYNFQINFSSSSSLLSGISTLNCTYLDNHNGPHNIPSYVVDPSTNSISFTVITSHLGLFQNFLRKHFSESVILKEKPQNDTFYPIN